MKPKQIAALLVGTLVFLRDHDRDQRGLTQSTENAILIGGAVAVATSIVIVITAFVKSHMP